MVNRKLTFRQSCSLGPIANKTKFAEIKAFVNPVGSEGADLKNNLCSALFFRSYREMPLIIVCWLE